jgi:ketosteroid isomerase-like protein
VVLARDAAAFTFKFRWSRTNKSGETMRASETCTYILKMINGQWKVIHSTETHARD